MKKDVICTICPRGCCIFVEGEDDQITSIHGYGCKRGESYATSEFTNPVRILTSTVGVVGKKNELLPVRSDKPLPKDKLLDCMKVLRATKVALPIVYHGVVVSDICGTGINIISTKSID